MVTLREGATPLIPVPSVAERIGRDVKVFVKYDGLNPTGSFKDRGMTHGHQQSERSSLRAVICASTGTLRPLLLLRTPATGLVLIPMDT